MISANGDDLIVEALEIEQCDEPVTVYNFKVEDYHTYFVGESAVWVHNKNCTPQNRQDLKDHLEGKKPTDGAKPDGRINGCHEEGVFLTELGNSGGDLTNNIQDVSNVNGVTYVEYTTSSGNVAKKTIYDSNVISTDDYINRGLEAYNKVPESITGGSRGVSITQTDNSGKQWVFFIRNNTLKNMYPVV